MTLDPASLPPSTAAAYVVETLVAGWLLLGVPLVGRARYRALAAACVDRVAFYRRAVLRQWAVTLVAVALIAGLGERPSDLGLAWRPRETVAMLPAVAELVVVGLAVALALRWQAARRPDRPLVRRLLRPVLALLPVTSRERRYFTAVAVTAGVTEEVLYRGIVTLWFVRTVPALGALGAVVASSVAFGLAHAYQGPAGVALTGLAGYAFGVMYVVTGSLVVPMALHAMVDLRVLLVLPPRPAPGGPDLGVRVPAGSPEAVHDGPSGPPASTGSGSLSSP